MVVCLVDWTACKEERHLCAFLLHGDVGNVETPPTALLEAVFNEIPAFEEHPEERLADAIMYMVNLCVHVFDPVYRLCLGGPD